MVHAAKPYPAALTRPLALRSQQLPALCTRRLRHGNTAWLHLWFYPPRSHPCVFLSAVVWCASDAGLPDGVRGDEDSLGLQGVLTAPGFPPEG